MGRWLGREMTSRIGTGFAVDTNATNGQPAKAIDVAVRARPPARKLSRRGGPQQLRLKGRRGKGAPCDKMDEKLRSALKVGWRVCRALVWVMDLTTPRPSSPSTISS